MGANCYRPRKLPSLAKRPLTWWEDFASWSAKVWNDPRVVDPLDNFTSKGSEYGSLSPGQQDPIPGPWT